MRIPSEIIGVKISRNRVTVLIAVALAFPKLGKPRCRCHSLPSPEVQPQYPIHDVMDLQYYEFHMLLPK